MARTLSAMVNKQEFHIPFDDDFDECYISESLAEVIQNNNIVIKNKNFFMILELGFENEQGKFIEIKTPFFIIPDIDCTFPIFLGNDFLKAEAIHSMSNFGLVLENEDKDLMLVPIHPILNQQKLSNLKSLGYSTYSILKNNTSRDN